MDLVSRILPEFLPKDKEISASKHVNWKPNKVLLFSAEYVFVDKT